MTPQQKKRMKRVADRRRADRLYWVVAVWQLRQLKAWEGME